MQQNENSKISEMDIDGKYLEPDLTTFLLRWEMIPNVHSQWSEMDREKIYAHCYWYENLLIIIIIIIL